MVVSRSDTKRRRKEDVALSIVVEAAKETSPKRAKVHAQRKFAQGSGSVSSPSVTPVKDKTKANDAAPPPKFIPSNRPKTEDFLTFLCFRGTPTLPARLDFFNIASLEDRLDDEDTLLGLDQSTRDSARNSRVSSSTISSNRKQRPVERNGVSHQNSVPAKGIVALAKNTKKKPDIAVQALKKKYQDQRLAKQRVTSTLNKLAQKVKGKNMVRTRSAGHQVEVVLEEKLRTPKKESIMKKKKPESVKTPPPPLKRLPSSSSKKRGGLRSGGVLPSPISKLKREKTRQKLILKSPPKQEKAKVSGKPFISSLSDFSSDDDQPLLKKARVLDKATISCGRNLAQKVKKRYAKHLPNKRLKPQILTRAQKQMNAMKAERKAAEKKQLKEAKERDALANKARMAEDKKKEQELKAKVEKEEKELKEKVIREAKEKEKNDLKIKEEIRRERERILESVKIEMKEKEISATKELEKKMRDKRSKESPAVASVSTRPSRKTKEAAAFYMEMLGKRLIGDHHDDDDDDDDLYSVSSFPELPNAKRNEQREKEIKAKAKDKTLSPPGSKIVRSSLSPTKKPDVSITNDETKKKIKKKKLKQGLLENNDNSGVEMKKEVPTNEHVAGKKVQPTQPIVKQPVVEEPVVKEPIAKEPVVKEDVKQEDQAPTSTRRRSLRTGPFQLHDYGSDCTDKKVKSKSKKAASSYFSLSESFSDSDEEPLGKLALRRQSSSEKTVMNEGVSSAEEKPASKPRKAREVPSGGMKGALRESITHTPFKFRQKSSTVKGAKAKNLEMDFKDVVDSLSIQLEERAIQALNKAAKKASIAQEKANAKLDAKLNLAVPVTEVQADISVKKPCNKESVIESKEIKETTVDCNNAGHSVLPQVTEPITNRKDSHLESAVDNLEMHLAIQPNQRNTKGKVNMSTEQIEKWLSESCSLPKPKLPETSQQGLFKSEEFSYQTESSKQAISPKSKMQQPILIPQEIKSIGLKSLRDALPAYSANLKYTKSSQPRIPSYKQSLNHAIKESIKDSEILNNRNRTPEKKTISPIKDISPISNLSISTTGISVLGESLSFGIGSRSSDDFSHQVHPERTPEKKPIFIHGRSPLQKARQRKYVKPSVNAFSPENESSVYAFDNDPEPPPMSKPFRRQNTRDSRASSVGTSKSEDDLSKLGLGDEEILQSPPQPYRMPQLPAATMKPFNRAASISKSEEYLARKALEKATESDRSQIRSDAAHSTIVPGVQQCLPHLRNELTVQIDPPSEVLSGDLNISNTTSNSDEDLSKVRERLLERRAPLQLSFADRQSASIAVQVNLVTDDDQSPLTDTSYYNQSLECCAQTEEDEDDNNGHLFYIPLAPGAVGANVTGSGMIQGVAVKLGTEGPTGPNQRVIMRAQLVTKPPTFNRSVNTTTHGISGRSLLGQPPRRPISSLPTDQKSAVGMSPIGTVQPTARPQPSPLGAVPPDASHKAVTPLRPDAGRAPIPAAAETRPNAAPSPAKAPAAAAASTSTAHRLPENVRGFYTENPSAQSSRIYAMLPAANPAMAKAKPQELMNVSNTIKWGFPSMHGKKECKTTYYTQTSDKVLVAKKEAFISAVPPLAPLSYSSKWPAMVANNVISKSVVKTAPVCKPSQVPSAKLNGSGKESAAGTAAASKPVVKLLPKPAVESVPAVVVVVASAAAAPAPAAAVPAPAVAAPMPAVVVPVPVVVAPANVCVLPAVDSSLPGPSTILPKAKRGYKRGKNAKLEVAANESDVTENFPKPGEPSKMVQAPTFYPTEAEFQDPIKYINRIRPIAEKFGICRVVPPANFKPECKVSDDMRFTAYNQYVHKTLHRWGPNVKEMMAIRKYLATQNITLKQPPYIGSIEIDLPRLYQTVQSLGGLKEVIVRARWQRVADEMKISKSAQDRVTKIDDIYCKYLLPYETLSNDERAKLLEDVETSWKEREEKSANRSHILSDDDDDDDEIDECIVKGRNMALNQFYRTARNTMAMWFKEPEPSAADVETEFWKLVTAGQSHVCVNAGSIESSRWGYGFPVSKNSPCAKHSWNLKVLTNNSGNVLRSIGPIMGVTVPTIHVGMLFTTCCWYRDPHGLPWVEYLHTGASKIWYGIPDECSGQLRGALTKLVPRCVKNKTIWLPSDTAMVPPPLLVENAVPLSRVVQEPGQFIVVFPRAFTSSICTGYLVSESVYFAQPSWLSTAEQVFKDIQGSCEPSMFSLERLLFSISTDTRSSVNVLKQILPMVQRIREQECAYRKQLAALGLKATDRLNLPETGGKKRKAAVLNDDGEFECEICRANLYVSLVTNGHEEGVYCLPHAIDHLTKHKHQLKYCKLLYTYNQHELTSLVQKLEERIQLKGQKRPQYSRPSLTVVK